MEYLLTRFAGDPITFTDGNKSLLTEAFVLHLVAYAVFHLALTEAHLICARACRNKMNAHAISALPDYRNKSI
ncbi:unnamed protein product [Protopolystoma xenopodis]|uniref:Uncharacterized protein n=1 Tax=Protopolystoma xenopodis TaxID=117903 RepID=A0A3S5AJB2_9PLAT|nr:unnamed protein product [Protopolystoma xenopodis]